jgi:hypothetical protein
MTTSATTTKKTTSDFPLAYSAMVALFPTVGPDFLDDLLCRLSGNVSDQELKRAITVGTKRNQRSEALWLSTIPTVLQNLRRADEQRKAVEAGEFAKLRAEAVAANDNEALREIDALLARIT